MSDPTNAERQARHRAKQREYVQELEAEVIQLRAENARLRANAALPSEPPPVPEQATHPMMIALESMIKTGEVIRHPPSAEDTYSLNWKHPGNMRSAYADYLCEVARSPCDDYGWAQEHCKIKVNTTAVMLELHRLHFEIGKRMTVMHPNRVYPEILEPFAAFSTSGFHVSSSMWRLEEVIREAESGDDEAEGGDDDLRTQRRIRHLISG